MHLCAVYENMNKKKNAKYEEKSLLVSYFRFTSMPFAGEFVHPSTSI